MLPLSATDPGRLGLPRLGLLAVMVLLPRAGRCDPVAAQPRVAPLGVVPAAEVGTDAQSFPFPLRPARPSYLHIAGAKMASNANGPRQPAMWAVLLCATVSFALFTFLSLLRHPWFRRGRPTSLQEDLHHGLLAVAAKYSPADGSHKGAGILAFVWEDHEPLLLVHEQRPNSARLTPMLAEFGGKREPSEPDAAATAAREFLEEIWGERQCPESQLKPLATSLRGLEEQFRLDNRNDGYYTYVLKLRQRPEVAVPCKWVRPAELKATVHQGLLHPRLRPGISQLLSLLQQMRPDTQGEGVELPPRPPEDGPVAPPALTDGQSPGPTT
eukprot:EG_transcript_19123